MKKTFVVKLAVAALLALGSFTQAQDDTAIPAVDSPATEAVQADNQASVSDNVSIEGEVELVAPVAPESVVYDSAVVSQSGCVGCGQVQPTANFATAPVSVGCSSCTGCGSVPTATYTQPTSNCGCGQVAYQQPVSNCGGCNSCNQVTQVAYQQPVSNCGGCNSCNQVAQVSYQQPVSSCGCNQVSQVSYDQPLYQQPTVSSVPTTLASTPTSIVMSPVVNPAPAPAVYTPAMTTQSPVYTPVASGCTSCGGGATTSYAPTSVGTSYFDGGSYAGTVSTGCDSCGTTGTRGRLRGRILRNR